MAGHPGLRARKPSVRALTGPTGFPVPGKGFDLIYSLGLTDGLSDPIAQTLIRRLFQLLVPGGELVLANGAADHPDRLVSGYWQEAREPGRTEKQFLDLVPKLAGSDKVLSYDATKIQMLLSVRKRSMATRRVLCEV